MHLCNTARGVAWLFAALLFAAPAAAIRPVLDADFADPFVLVTPRGLVAYATNSDRDGRRLNVPRATSRDGIHWSALGDAMPTRPRWARATRPDIWAPEVVAVGDAYVLYFSARHATRTRADGLTLCVGAAVAGRPEGPFIPQPEPLSCGGASGLIDASPFRDGTGLWLYAKTDGNCCGVPTAIVAAPLSADALHLAGDLTPVGVTNDEPWEGKVVEGPEMRRHDGALVLFFAGANYARADYAFGYARCDSVTGPCHAAPENPILTTRPGLVGPGHGSVFDWQGRTWLAIAAWRSAPRRRAMYLLPIEWIDSRPVIPAAP